VVSARLQKSGGLLPIVREWFFYSDGKIHHPNGETTMLEANRIGGLLNPTKINELSELKSEYPPPPGSADFETIELTVRGSESIFNIIAVDSNDLVPDTFWDFCDALQDVANNSLAESKKK